MGKEIERGEAGFEGGGEWAWNVEFGGRCAIEERTSMRREWLLCMPKRECSALKMRKEAMMQQKSCGSSSKHGDSSINETHERRPTIGVLMSFPNRKRDLQQGHELSYLIHH